MKPLADFTKEAVKVVKLAEKRGITLRVMGACSVKLHCPKCGYLHEQMGRELTDIDFVSYSRFESAIEKFFKDLGYKPRKYIFKDWARATSLGRHIYDDEKNKIAIDVFFDKLQMCHTIDFRGRLELDDPTITLADILLEKMQIVKLNEKDVKDTVILLREHKVGDNDIETINGKYIARLLSKDWGFYYTVTTNLNRVREFLKRFKALNEEDHNDVSTKIDALIQLIEKRPKSLGWKMRAKIGPRKKWYTEVEEAVLPGASLEN